jgi:hypothetical protein
MGTWEALTLIILAAISVLALFIGALMKRSEKKLDDIHDTARGIRTKLEDHAMGAEHHRRSWSDRWRSFTVQLDSLMDEVRGKDKKEGE